MFVLKGVLRAESQERILIFLLARGRGYAKGIADFYSASLTPIQAQLSRLEADGVVVGRQVGGIREFEINPRYFFREELLVLLQKALSAYPEEVREALLMDRRRPRSRHKPVQFFDKNQGAS